jgi:hypothetical protein
VFLVGVSSGGSGDSDTDLATGLRRVGSLEPPEPGVSSDVERTTGPLRA